MLTLEHLQKKIKTTRELLSVVKTMKTLAAVNIRHYEGAAASLEKYNDVIDMGWQILFRSQVTFPRRRSKPDTILLVLGSDQGMCGHFNDIALDLARTKREELARQNRPTLFWTVGERIRSGLEDTNVIAEHHSLPGSIAAINSHVQLIVQQFEAYQRKRGIDCLHLIHNKIIKGGVYQPVWMQLLPLDRNWLTRYKERPWPGSCLPMTGIDREELFHRLFSQYLFASLYRAFAQSIASENAARLASMQAAEKNILELAEELQAKFRETRQSTITEELFDIVAGFEAISDSRHHG
jgi:F-type H+-transporting ATPase subunit gamma